MLMADPARPVKWARLPFLFDAALLRADLSKVNANEWVAHYNQADYSGGWSGVSLRSTNGSAAQLFTNPSATEFNPTPVLERCTYLQEVLSKFECPLKAVRLLRLEPGSRVLEHTDADLRYEDGELRFHVPIATNPETDFVVGGRRLPLAAGEAWYIDFSQPHRIHNRGATDRIHMVIDARQNDWSRSVIEGSERPEGTEAAPDSEFETFRQLVYGDEALQATLLETPNPEKFFERTAELGRTRGFSFTATDVRVAYRAGARAWMERKAGM
jgi:hypothetical protein